MSDRPDGSETGTIEVSRVIDAPAERIYNAFLDADALGKFSPPAGYTATYDHVEPEVHVPLLGRYVEAVRPIHDEARIVPFDSLVGIIDHFSDEVDDRRCRGSLALVDGIEPLRELVAHGTSIVAKGEVATW